MRNKTLFPHGRVYSLLLFVLLGYPMMVANAQTASGENKSKSTCDET